MKNRNVCENEPHSPLLLSGAGPHGTLGCSVKSPCLPHPIPQSQSISLLCDFPETRFSSSDRQLIPPLASGLYLNTPSWGRDPTAHTEGISSILLFHLSCPLTLLFLASLTASRDGAVGEGRSGERLGWYLLSTGFAFLQTRHEYNLQVN